MKTISSKAGTRLAKARVALIKADQWERTLDPSPSRLEALSKAHDEFQQAAYAVADELVAAGHHLQVGDLI